MTRLVLLLDEAAILLLESPLPPGVLAGVINSGAWQPPRNLPELVERSSHLELHAVSLGGMVVAAPVMQPAKSHTREVGAAISPLTARQQQVLKGLSEGLTDRQIAARLGITARAVAFHVQKLKMRLNTRSRYQAAIGRRKGKEDAA